MVVAVELSGVEEASPVESFVSVFVASEEAAGAPSVDVEVSVVVSVVVDVVESAEVVPVWTFVMIIGLTDSEAPI